VRFLWLSDQPDAETLPDKTQEANIHAPAGFEPTIPASERQLSQATERAATGIGGYLLQDKEHSMQSELRQYQSGFVERQGESHMYHSA